MTYVKRGAQLLLVDDDKVPKYTDKGFAVFELPGSKAGVDPPEPTEEEKVAEKAQKKAAAAAKKAAAQSAGEPDAKDSD